MKKTLLAASLIIFFALVAATPLFSADPASPDGWRPLFNGRDLTGWVPLNVAPDTFQVRDGIIVSSGIPTGMLRTDRQYENFELELEWRHLKPGGNAGVFLWSDPLPPPGSPFPRGMEVQVLDNGFNIAGKNEWYTTHGDVFPVHGATMTPTGRVSKTGERSFPSEDRSKSSPEWNHYRIVATNGVIRLSVNGKEVTVGQDCQPRQGYLCLESEGSECHFRHLRLRELPATNPRPEETANLAEGFTLLYNGVDLRGWKPAAGHQGHWQPKDWILAYDGQSEAEDKNLWTQREYGDFVMVCDWRWTRKPVKALLPVLLPNGDEAVGADGKPQPEEVPNAGDSGIYLRGSSKSQVNIWCWPVGSGEVYGYRTDRSLPPEVRAAVTPKKRADKPIGEWNRFIITMRGDRLTVNLNGDTVIDQAPLPGVPARGPLALQHHGDPIEFANLFIREIPIEKPAPRIAMLWASLRGDSSLEAQAKHDLVMVGHRTLGLKLNQQPAGLADGFTPDSIAVARVKVKRMRELNPGVIVLGDLPFYEYPDNWLPEDHAWWLRKDGQRQQFWPGTHRMNWHDPAYRRHVVQQTVSLKQSGVDGVFYDNLREEPGPWIAFLKEVRANAGDDFLILANSGYSVGQHDFAAPYLNGFMYESGWSHQRTEWDEVIRRMQHSETLLRTPRISLIERFEETRDHAGWPGDGTRGQKPPDDPAARRWSLCYALAVGDFFYLFSDNTSHRHDWHAEYDVRIGPALGPGERVSSHVWKRRYAKALVVVNLPGAKESFALNLETSAKDSLTGEEGKSFVIAPGDGRILLKP